MSRHRPPVDSSPWDGHGGRLFRREALGSCLYEVLHTAPSRQFSRLRLPGDGSMG